MRIYVLALCLWLSACTSKELGSSNDGLSLAKEPSEVVSKKPLANSPTLGRVGLGASGLAKRVLMSRAECLTANGHEVGDIDDGRIHRADYLCVNGSTPLGTIISREGEPIAVEGVVCCGGSD